MVDKYLNYVQEKFISKQIETVNSKTSLYDTVKGIEGIFNIGNRHVHLRDRYLYKGSISIKTDSSSKDNIESIRKGNLSDFISVTDDGKLIIDYKALFEWLNSKGSVEVLVENSEKFKAISNALVSGISMIMIYKGVVKTYDIRIERSLKHIKNESARIKFIESANKRKFHVSAVTSIILKVGLKLIVSAYNSYYPSTIDVRFNKNDASSINETNKSVIFLLSYFKNKKIKYFIFLLIGVGLYLLYPYLIQYKDFFNIFISKNFFLV